MANRDWSAEVDAICDLIETHYLHPDVARDVIGVLRSQLAAGAYRAAADDAALALAVTTDAVAATGDVHLRLRHSRAPLGGRARQVVPESGRDPLEAAATGHGIAKVERLAGNVGLLDIRRFWPLSMSRHAAVGAMHLVADTEVLIVDLRRSAGGEPEMVAFLCSYLFDARVHLNDLVFPADGRTIGWWTDPSVPSPTFGRAKPVYVLVGPKTISAAEEFAYDLKQLGRATLVGGTTAGAGNFDYRYKVGAHLMMSVPSGGPVNPVSGEGWEGVGVQPDVSVEPEDAFDVAYRAALEHIVGLGEGEAWTGVFAEAVAALAAL